MTTELKEYIKNWKSLDQPPKNEPQFIALFLDYIRNIEDERDVEFNGEGSYFGKEISIVENSMFPVYDESGGFEIAYQKDYKISVYRHDNHGFWTPEYLALTPKDDFFIEVQTTLFSLLQRVFGL